MKQTNVFPCAGGGGSFLNRLAAVSAFTMAEILLSLTIIGVVAAITLPSLTGNINERTWATQKKALYARMSQAFPLLDSINTYDDAESFIAGALNTVTKINNVCSESNIEDCGINKDMVGTLNGGALNSFPSLWTDLGIGSASVEGIDDMEEEAAAEAQAAANKAGFSKYTAAFETGNGESIVLFYNPNCVPDQEMSARNLDEDWFKYVCVNMVYDLNNNKGPNTVGKDIGFMTVFYPTDSVVVSTVPNIGAMTTSCNDTEYRVPNKFESMSIALNNLFVNAAKLTSTEPALYTSSKGADGNDTFVYYVEGEDVKTYKTTDTAPVTTTRCVKR